MNYGTSKKYTYLRVIVKVNYQLGYFLKCRGHCFCKQVLPAVAEIKPCIKENEAL